MVHHPTVDDTLKIFELKPKPTLPSTHRLNITKCVIDLSKNLKPNSILPCLPFDVNHIIPFV